MPDDFIDDNVCAELPGLQAFENSDSFRLSAQLRHFYLGTACNGQMSQSLEELPIDDRIDGITLIGMDVHDVPPAFPHEIRIHCPTGKHIGQIEDTIPERS